MKFTDLKLSPEVQEGLDAFGFDTLTPIQEAAIPVILSGKDLIGIAQTGTGKTMAFAIPTVERLISQKSNKGPRTLVLAPTRELALQIEEQFLGLTYFCGVSSSAVYGGGDASEFERQKQALVKGADILIATPGRLLAHIKLGYVSFDNIEILILDEADRMLDMGFREDILSILGKLPKKRQTLLFSATISQDIKKFAKGIMHEPETVAFSVSKPAEGVVQGVYEIREDHKLDLIRKLLEGKELERVLIFSATKKSVKLLETSLRQMGLKATAMHSDLDQSVRKQIMLDFKNKKVPILVATDIVSRGIDIDNIELVINMNVPHDPEDYVHRVGRTARAKNTGVALTFVDPKEKRYLDKIEKLIGYKIYRLSAS